ncbi:MAG: metal-dependent transcriptional regulator [Candidatus Hydrogenedentes bacterium]|nr:metal-dependent transcriptional regulator [Candidatus Hydrogenedentota bacterium]
MPAYPLTAALEDYLEAVYVLASGESGARVGDIAKQVNVHKSTVTAALHSLADRKLVNYVPYKPITLTPHGKRLGSTILKRHKTLRRFLTSVLAVDGDVAEETACKMEHVIPPEVIDRFTGFAEFIEVCPRTDIHFTREHGYFCETGPGRAECERCVAATLADLRGRGRAPDEQDGAP